MAKIIVSILNMPEVCHDLAEDVVTIGRTASNHIQIVHPSISSHHARLDRIPSGYKLTDLGSTNKTWVNGKPIRELELTNSLTVRFGAISCRFNNDPVVVSKSVETEPNEALCKQIAELNAKIAANSSQLEMAIKDRNASQQSRQQLFSKLEEATQIAKKGSSQISALASKLKETELQIAMLNEARELAEVKITETQKQAATIRIERDTLEKELVAANEQISQIAQTGNSQSSTLASKLKETELQIAMLNEARELAEVKITETQKQVATIRMERDTLEKELAVANEQIAQTSNSQSSTLAAKLKESELQIATLNEARESAEAQVEMIRLEWESGQVELAETRKQVKGILGLNKELTDRLEQHEQQIAVFSSEQVKLQDARDRALEEIEEFQLEIEAARSSNQHLYAQIGEANQKLEEVTSKAEQEMALLSANFSEAKLQIETLADLNGELGKQLQQSYQEYENFNIQTTEASQIAAAEMAKISTTLADAIREIESLHRERDSLTLKNLELTKQMELERQQFTLNAQKQRVAPVVANPPQVATTMVKPVVIKAKIEEPPRQAIEIDKTRVSDESLQKILETAPQTVAVMRNGLQYFLRHPSDSKVLLELEQKVSSLVEQINSIPYHPVYKISSGVKALLDEFIKFPEQMNRNTLRTLGQGFDCLVTLVDPKIISETNQFSQPKVLVVDDDAEVAAEFVSALTQATLNAASCVSAKSALDLLNKEKFDLVLLDIKMPEINGLDLCPMIRRSPLNQKTPILFVTGAATPDVRANSTLAGGNDLIAKPFDIAEIALKSLVWIYKGQLEWAQKMRKAA